jgi:hypothetical protein
MLLKTPKAFAKVREFHGSLFLTCEPPNSKKGPEILKMTCLLARFNG